MQCLCSAVTAGLHWVKEERTTSHVCPKTHQDSQFVKKTSISVCWALHASFSLLLIIRAQKQLHTATNSPSPYLCTGGQDPSAAVQGCSPRFMPCIFRSAAGRRERADVSPNTEAAFHIHFPIVTSPVPLVYLNDYKFREYNNDALTKTLTKGRVSHLELVLIMQESTFILYCYHMLLCVFVCIFNSLKVE